jgi:ADP-ribosylglycohydrolase
MLGAIAGDIIGSVHEHAGTKTADFPLFHDRCRFTDDTVLTAAVAHAILEGRSDYYASIKTFARRYPDAGYGREFKFWVRLPDGESEPYNSWGNGSAMRVSPVGWAFETAEEVLEEARKSAEVTHNHPEGIRGAQAVALAVFLARSGAGKESIRQEVGARFGYDLDRTLDEIRPAYTFKSSCQESVPESLIAFFEADSVEDAIRKAVSLGGDADTMASIAGAVAHPHFKHVPQEITHRVRGLLTPDLLDILDRFSERYGCAF